MSSYIADSVGFRRLCQWAFLIVFPIWTILLIRPHPLAELADDFQWSELFWFLLNKSTHIAGYAGLTSTAIFWLKKPWKNWIIVGLLLHGGLSEMAQHYGNLYFQTKRYGCVRDVIVNAIGIGIGVFIVWVYQQLKKPTEANASN